MNVRLAIVGVGRWGINHVKTAATLLGRDLRLVCDLKNAGREQIAALAPHAEFTNDICEVANRTDINAVIIATPAETHFDIASLMLRNGKACLVEKPLTLDCASARRLIAVAKQQNQLLMVGHILMFHPAVAEMKRLVARGAIGKLQYIYSNRLNLGTVRSEENILWSFAPHDIAIIQYLIGSKPIAVDAKGATFLQRGIEDITVTHLTYSENIHAHIFVSWLHPFKEQRLVVIGDKGMIVFEDSAPKEKLRFYRKGIDIEHGALNKFDAPYQVVRLSAGQPLELEQRHFYDCVRHDRQPLTDGAHALEVLSVLELAEKKLKSARN